MKHIITMFGAFLMTMTTPVLASPGKETTEISLMAIIFLGFGALIIVGQLMPALILLFSALRGFFRKTAKKSVPEEDIKTL